MKTAVIESVCECQTKLRARLDEHRQVLEGWAVDRRGRRERAPAQSLGASSGVFAVGWSCPVCTRNTLRSFHAAGLAYHEPQPAAS